MTTNRSLRNRFVGFMLRNIEDIDSLENPMALFNKFLEKWKKPLNAEAMGHAYQAAWAVFINQGLVKL